MVDVVVGGSGSTTRGVVDVVDVEVDVVEVDVVTYSYGFNLDLVDNTLTSQSEFTARSDIWAEIQYTSVPIEVSGDSMKIEIPDYSITRIFGLPSWSNGGPEDNTKWYCPTPAGNYIQFVDETNCNDGGYVYYCSGGTSDHSVLNGVQCFSNPDCEIEDGDGISHKKEGGLKLEFKWERQDNNTYKVFASLI